MIATTPPALATWLAAARSALVFDAYTLISSVGTTARWIDADFDFTVPDAAPRSFVRGPVFERGSIKQSVGLSVDSLSFRLFPQARNAPVMFGAQTLLAAAQNGTLRGATLQLERFVFDADNTYQGRWVEFAGTFAVKNTAGGVIKADALSELNLLDVLMPRELYQSQCKNQVFDTNCGLAKAAWQVTGTVGGLATGALAKSQFNSGLTAQPVGWFDQGTVLFTSGPNAGIKRTVKSSSSGTFVFALPWPNTLGVGQTFIAVPGCNRSLNAGGCAKFANQLRFRGEPFIPQPETVN